MKEKKTSLAAVLCTLFVGLALALLALFVPAYSARAAGIRYAAPVAQGSGNCSSWENACTLQTALTGAASGDEIWVRAGVHYPGSMVTDTFALKSGVALYGGFTGTETMREERDWTANLTVLSGDIDQNDLTDPTGVVTDTANITGTNSYHVVTSSGVTETAVLDGFTVTAGQANGTEPNNNGGGMTNYDSSPTLNNLAFIGNSADFAGGGIYNTYGNPTLTNVVIGGNSADRGAGMMNYYDSSPTLTEVTFNNNSANSTGGGMANYYDSSPTLTNITFLSNSAEQGGGMYDFSNSSPVLTSTIFIDNSANYCGGMYNVNSSPSLTNVTFSNNSANFSGGMYNNANSSPTLINVTFSDNTASYGGGMVNSDNSNPTLTDVTFSGNSAEQDGGGMYNNNSSPTLTGVTFSDNSALNKGGGMANVGSQVTMTHATFSGNSSWGAGISQENSSYLVLTHATFSDNYEITFWSSSYSDFILTDVTFSGNGGGGWGAMVAFDAGNSLLQNVTFSGNIGNGLYWQGAYPPITPELKNVAFIGNAGFGFYNYWGNSPSLTNVLFSGNRDGGMVNNFNCFPTLTNVVISGNGPTDGSSGGMMNNWSTPLLQNSIVWGNGAPGSPQIHNGDNSDTVTRYSLVEGCNPGGVWNAACGTDGGNNLPDTAPLFVDPQPASGAPTTAGDYRLQDASPAINAGNNAALPPGILTDLDGNPRFVRVFVDMGAYENQTFPCPAGGMLYVDMDATGDQTGASWADALLTVQDALQVTEACEIWVAKGLYSPDQGGSHADDDRTATFQLKSGVALYGGFAGTETARDQRDWTANVTVLSGDIDQNDLTDPIGVITNTAYITGTNSYHVVTSSGVTETAVLDGFVITAGQANIAVSAVSWSNYGGGMCNIGNSSPSLKNVIFSGNFAIFGGGMLNHQGSSPTLTNVTFSDNTATHGGGMHNLWDSNPTLINVIFSGNSASWGGGMENDRSNPTLTEVTFSGNTAWEGGGMFNLYGSPTLTNVTFSGNMAVYYGGGMYNYGSNPTLTNVNFGENSASYGGGMFNISSYPSLTDITFIGNSATWGGGMFNDSSSSLLTNVTFSGNTAYSEGGGMYNYWTSPALTNVLFSGNSATGDGSSGGGMYNFFNSNPMLINVTFSGNLASVGGGMYNAESSPIVSNSILWANTPEQMFNDSNSHPSLSYTDVQGGCPAASTCTHILDADPLFVDAANGDLRLAPGSPAIDAGNNYSVTVTTDLSGGPRFVEIPAAPDTGLGTPPLVDMGAYEANFVDVGLAKAVSPLEAAPGQLITYTLTFSNGGSLPAAGVVITDVVPSYLAVQSVSYGGVVITDTGQTPPYTWLVQNLSAGQGGVITLTAILTEPLAAGMYTNTASITASADAGAGNNLAEAGLGVLNLPPLAQGEVYTTLEDVPLHVDAPGVLANDYDPNGDPLTATLISLPAVGLLALQPDGAFVYTPTLNFNGEVTFTYTTSDGWLSDTAAITITINAVNDAPVAEDDTFSTPEETAYSGALTASDVEDDPLDFGLDTAPQHGVVSIDPDGSFTYTPTLDYNGADVFTFTVSDGSLSDLGRVEITVTPINDAPIANAGPDQSVDAPDLVTLDGSASYDPDGNLPLAYQWTQTGGPTVTLSDPGAASPTFTAPPIRTTLTFTLLVTDSLGLASAPDEVTVTVEGIRVFLPMIVR